MNINKLNYIKSLGLATALVTSAQAESKLTGSASLDVNTHFMSYGFDVWQAGKDPDSAVTFNPSVSLNYQVNDSFSVNTGFWLDVNDNVAATGFNENETDVWVGVAYTSGITTASATFQSWQYAGDSEEVLDLGLSFDTVLSPSITLHKRLDGGASGGFNGTFAVFGASHTFELTDKYSLTIPVNLGFALDEFHTTESGYGFASIGLQSSYVLNDYSSLNFGMTFYDTDNEVVGNADDSFVTYNLGVSFSF